MKITLTTLVAAICVCEYTAKGSFDIKAGQVTALNAGPYRPGLSR